MKINWKFVGIGMLILAVLPLLLNPLGLALGVLGLLAYPFIKAAMRAGAEDAERMRNGLPPKHAGLGHNPFDKDGKW